MARIEAIDERTRQRLVAVAIRWLTIFPDEGALTHTEAELEESLVGFIDGSDWRDAE